MNLIVDIFGFLIFCFFIGFILGFFGLAGLIVNFDGMVLNTIFLVSYYLLFEGVWGKTPAKFLTKTKVITKEGHKPSLGNIFVRTLCRFIPFDAFSFLSSNPVGWHDSLPKTLVVDEV